MERRSKDIILINTFIVNESTTQQQVVDKLENATKQILNNHSGFLSTRIYKSVDGIRVMSYVQWENKESIEKMLNDPDAIIHMNDISKLAKVDRSLYELAYKEEKDVK